MNAGSISATGSNAKYQFSMFTEKLKTNHNELYNSLETFTPLRMASEGKDIFIDADASVIKIARLKEGYKAISIPAATATVDKILYLIGKIHK